MTSLIIYNINYVQGLVMAVADGRALSACYRLTSYFYA